MWPYILVKGHVLPYGRVSLRDGRKPRVAVSCKASSVGINKLCRVA